ncbi:HEPN domain-containing protein [Lactobacillus helveticus]|uniref:HEPN domain-containing protein n=1 Tax=Lactobacillus helveticus TaxID=1587 RepID=UPI00156297A6|nr:HEPN domain-containing protein [Lactobacillus helveticus]NRO29103.1 hypothetical protein [Lactobacillus helveticus]NRO68800.1 hypothetical protein [Lactobacillus helveticus]NRO71053.1 hypothetical protein [Lactobacillus helveticus]
MKQRIIDYSLNETVHSSFSLMGHFSKSPKTKDTLEGSTGTLNYHDGEAKVEMTPVIDDEVGNAGAHIDVENEDDAMVYGCLEDGTYVRFNSFSLTHGIHHAPGFSVAKYVVDDIAFSKHEFNLDDRLTYDHVLVTYDSLNEFGAFVVPELMKKERSENLPFFIGGSEDFDVYLTYEWKQYGNRVNVSVKAQVELEIRIKRQNSKVDTFIKDFGNFLLIINNSTVNTTSVRYFDKDGNVLRTHLFAGPHTERNGKTDYSYGINSEFNFDNYQDKLKQIMNFILTEKNDQFDKLVQNYLYNIDDDLNLDSALINYVNSIDIYMNGRRYSDGTRIKKLFKKIDFWLEQFPEKLYGLYFDKSKRLADDDKRDAFIQSLVDTRDYLTHFDKKNSPYLISDSDRVTYITQIRALIHIYILHTYGIPDDSIWNYYRRFILDRIS